MGLPSGQDLRLLVNHQTLEGSYTSPTSFFKKKSNQNILIDINL